MSWSQWDKIIAQYIATISQDLFNPYPLMFRPRIRLMGHPRPQFRAKADLPVGFPYRFNSSLSQTFVDIRFYFWFPDLFRFANFQLLKLRWILNIYLTYMSYFKALCTCLICEIFLYSFTTVFSCWCMDVIVKEMWHFKHPYANTIYLVCI